MRQISEPDDRGTEDTAEDLHERRHEELRERVDADEHLTERDGRIEVALRCAERRCSEDAERDRETPSDGNVDPARCLAFRFLQREVRADAATKDEEYGGSDELTKQVFCSCDHDNSSLKNSSETLLKDNP